MQQTHRNSFEGGLKADIDPNRIEPNSYVEAHNVELVSDGKFFSLKNIKGTSKVEDIINVSGTKVLGTFSNFYKIGDTTNVKCLTIITVNTSLYKIWCYDTENDALYELYEEATPDGYITTDRLVQGRSYAENGIDILYFTDDFFELRQLRCEIPSPYSANFLSSFDLSLQRWGANGTINPTISTGGSLLSGTYQFAYRMCDPDTKKFTRWSSLTNPIHVYNTTTDSRYISGIGLYTNRKITLDVNPSQLELDNFDYFQLCVIENIYPEGAFSVQSGEITTFYASLLPITSNTDIGSYEYKANYKIGTISIDELTIDYASIESAKTLAFSQNRMLVGNINYKNLTLDSTPSVLGSVITNNENYTDTPATIKKGYFRDEVYRFGIIYFDKYGNKSAPYTFDMTSITDNQISGATDMKFPARSLSNTYALLNSSNSPVSLGLSLTMDGHPTWAVGFEVVRLERKKRILSQTPVIPFAKVKGIGAFYNYPTVYLSDESASVTEDANAQPMTSEEIYIPKNLFWPELRSIGTVDLTAGAGYDKRYKGEAKLEKTSDYNFCGIFPQSSQYNNLEFKFTGSEKLETIDYVNLKLNLNTFISNSYADGEILTTDASGNFYASTSNQYFFDSSWTGKSIDSTSAIVDSKYLDNYSTGDILSGAKLCKFSELHSDGFKSDPNVQRMTVVKLQTSLNDDDSSVDFSIGTHNSYADGSFITGSSGATYQSSTIAGGYDNSFIYEYPSYVEGDCVQMIRISNIVNPDIGDDRYGNTSFDGFISTGAKYTFNPSELSSVAASDSLPITMEVWGGDCFVSSHIFKVCDSTYSVVNNKKVTGSTSESNDTLLYKWGRKYGIPRDGIDPWISMPVALKGASQFIQVYLESEYNGEAVDNDILTTDTTSGSMKILETTSQNLNRSCLTYSYNINVNKNNSQKVYFEKPDFSFERYNFGSRIQYSDIKIYNSSEQGFDIFRVGNIFDQEEAGGDITKLCISKNNVYSIQQKRISYLPIGEKVIETTEAGTLQVGTGDVINPPRILFPTRGGQHIGAIVETGDSIIVPDNRNKAIYLISEQDVKTISDEFVASIWRDKFSNVLDGNSLLGLLDPIRKEYWIWSDGFCYVYNYMLGLWVSNYEFLPLSGEFTNQKLYLLGKVEDQISAYTMYTANSTTLFGEEVSPRVKFYVNPTEYSKTFDNMMFNSTDRLDSVDLTVAREIALGDQTTSVNIDTNPVEGNYRIKVLRDNDNSRLRGLRMSVILYWSDLFSNLSSVITKYRSSSRRPY